ncbi:MAG: radical SAM family heme chaperone HemW [Alphaproteobacteria bacterium]
MLRPINNHLKNRAGAGLYFHWPFCLAKCPYCDFNVHINPSINHDAWEAAYLKSIAHYHELMPDIEIASVFFGGGTPSLMRPAGIEKILQAVAKKWDTAVDLEVTLEANPTSVEIEKFAAFRAAGINRVSLGVQALNDEDLAFLGRKHNVKEALKAIDITQKLFERSSFDLIYARPGQKLQDWERELRGASNRIGSHLSCYQLTIERGTPFYFEAAQGRFQIPDQDRAAEFYLLTRDILGGLGLPAYEVSNHARPGHESRHNLIYWSYGDYIGIGPGAHGRLTLNGEKFATREHSQPDIWLQKVEEGGSGAHPYTHIPPRERFVEALMMGLRVREGVWLESIQMQSGYKIEDVLDRAKIEKSVAEGWVSFEDNRLKPGAEGWLRLNALIPYIMKAA